jgi:hypothetical protein
MSSAKRIEANRRNAQRSTGPRTPEGKSRSRFNALQLGLTAKLPVLPGEDAQAYQGRLDAWTARLRPRNPIEQSLVEVAPRWSRVPGTNRLPFGEPGFLRPATDGYILTTESGSAGREGG